MIISGMNILFTDPLAANLFVLGTFFIAIAIYLGITYLAKRYKEETDRSFGYFLIFTGLYFSIYGLFFSFLTPKPLGVSYSILFDDSLTILGFLAIFSGFTIMKKLDLLFVGVFALFAGIYAIISGVSGYLLNMTRNPVVLIILFLCSGIAGVLTLPLTFTKNRILVSIIIALLVIAAIVAFITGGSAVYEHLEGFAHISGA